MICLPVQNQLVNVTFSQVSYCRRILFFTSCPKICLHRRCCTKLRLYCEHCQTTQATLELEQYSVCWNTSRPSQSCSPVPRTTNHPKQKIQPCVLPAVNCNTFKCSSKSRFCHPQVMLYQKKGEAAPSKLV